jgi:hypothetical protein
VTYCKGEHWRIRNNKEIKYILQGADIVKCIKSPRLRWYDIKKNAKPKNVKTKLRRLQWKEK